MPVWARENGVDVDLKNTTTVEVQLVADDGVGAPTPPDAGGWTAGEWEVDEVFDVTYARGLIATKPAGTYRMWVRISGAGVSPEIPILTHDVLFEVF
jgi:hypothetical protein